VRRNCVVLASTPSTVSLFDRFISHQPAVLFSQNEPVTGNQPAVLFSQNKSAPAINHQPTEQDDMSVSNKTRTRSAASFVLLLFMEPGALANGPTSSTAMQEHSTHGARRNKGLGNVFVAAGHRALYTWARGRPANVHKRQRRRRRTYVYHHGRGHRGSRFVFETDTIQRRSAQRRASRRHLSSVQNPNVIYLDASQPVLIDIVHD
jgi:hypothetical protein